MVDPAHAFFNDYQRGWQHGDWWSVRRFDKAFGRELPALAAALSDPMVWFLQKTADLWGRRA